MPDPAKHLFFAIGEMFGQPALEKRRDREWQPNDGVAGELRARVGASLQDRGHFVIRQAGYDRRNHHAHRNPRFSQCVIASNRARGEEARGSRTRWSFGIDRSDGNIDRRGLMSGQLNLINRRPG